MRVTEREIIQYLQRAGDQYAPLTIKGFEEQVLLPQGYQADAMLTQS